MYIESDLKIFLDELKPCKGLVLGVDYVWTSLRWSVTQHVAQICYLHRQSVSSVVNCYSKNLLDTAQTNSLLIRMAQCRWHVSGHEAIAQQDFNNSHPHTTDCLELLANAFTSLHCCPFTSLNCCPFFQMISCWYAPSVLKALACNKQYF